MTPASEIDLITRVLSEMTWRQRVALLLVASRGYDGLGDGHGAKRSTLLSLVTRGLAKEKLGPADRPGDWRFIATDLGKDFASVAVFRAQAGLEADEAIAKLRKAKLISAKSKARAA